MTTTGTFGEFDDDKSYTVDAIAKKWGLSIAKAREILRDNFHHADLGNGLLVISGLSFRLDIERLSGGPVSGVDDGVLPTEPHRRNRPSKKDEEPTEKPKPRGPKRRKKPEQE